MRFSWIITIIAVYILCVLLYLFQDVSTPFWFHYFWIVTCLNGIAGWSFNFVKRKTERELAFILFVTCLRTFVVFYYLVGLIFNKTEWMNTNVYFLIIMTVSAFIGMFFKRIKA